MSRLDISPLDCDPGKDIFSENTSVLQNVLPKCDMPIIIGISDPPYSRLRHSDSTGKDSHNKGKNQPLSALSPIFIRFFFHLNHNRLSTSHFSVGFPPDYSSLITRA